jgi:formylglycine-generating enzyme required for sulfatase activity
MNKPVKSIPSAISKIDATINIANKILTKKPNPFTMVFVDGGAYMMGCDQGQEIDGIEDEQPAHPVTLSSFYIGKYLVTQEEWEHIMGDNPSKFINPGNPVDLVSWELVQEFLTRLNELTGGNFRLPTEAEWEYAARGGIYSKGFKYSGSNNLDEVAWYAANSANEIHEVGLKKPNELGLYDMSGNVWEWCSDWFGVYSSENQFNPRGPVTGTERVLRGGCKCHADKYSRVSSRTKFEPGITCRGFRLASSISPVVQDDIQMKLFSLV